MSRVTWTQPLAGDSFDGSVLDSVLGSVETVSSAISSDNIRREGLDVRVLDVDAFYEVDAQTGAGTTLAVGSWTTLATASGTFGDGDVVEIDGMVEFYSDEQTDPVSGTPGLRDDQSAEIRLQWSDDGGSSWNYLSGTKRAFGGQSGTDDASNTTQKILHGGSVSTFGVYEATASGTVQFRLQASDPDLASAGAQTAQYNAMISIIGIVRGSA